MSRLYDELLAARGGAIDTIMQGAVTEFGKLLEKAQCFNMSDEISVVCSEVCRSRPSSILSAIDMTRAPYPLTWIEWAPNARLYSVENNKPRPRKIGTLLMTNDTGAKGYLTLAWVHDKHDISLDPLALIYDWDSKSTEPVLTQYAKHYGFGDRGAHADAKKRAALLTYTPEAGTRWIQYHKDPEEKQAIIALELRASLVPLDFCTEFMDKAQCYPGAPMYESYANDLDGELPFIEAFLLLLNSRNTIVEQTRDDFSRLNKARAKSRKPELREFINTRIKLNRVQTNRAIAATGYRAPTHIHLVRGHFKVRRSGVYWWTSHTRGTTGPAPPRKEYRV